MPTEDTLFTAKNNKEQHVNLQEDHTIATISIISNEGTPESASAVLEVTATNPEYNQPALRIKQAGERGGAASIRIDDPNPDID